MSDRGSPLLDAFSLPSFLDSSEQEMPDVLVSYEHMDILSFLPGEVAIFVLELLPVEDLCRVQQVSRTWYELCRHSRLQLKIQEYRLDWGLRKENHVAPSDRLCRRLSSGMINRELDSPFAALQVASPTPDESLLLSGSGQQHTLEAPGVRFVDDYHRSCTSEQSLQLIRPQPVRLFTRPWTPTQDDLDSAPPVGSKASKRRLKRF